MGKKSGKPAGIGSAKRAAARKSSTPWGMYVGVAVLAVALFFFLGGDDASSSASSSASPSSSTRPPAEPEKNVGVGGGKYYGGECPKSAHYLLYDVGAGERFNMRKAIVLRPINTAKALAEKLGGDVTLVLPPFKQFGDELYERWDRFFDTAGMEEIGLKVCEQDQYWNTVKPRVDFVYLPGQECPAEAMARRDFKQDVFGANVEVGELFCAGKSDTPGVPECTSKPFVAKLAAALEGATVEAPKAVMVPSMESVSPNHEPGNKGRLLVQQHTRFSGAIAAAARDWATSSALGGRKYVSMHLRRGDFMRAHAKHAPSLTDVTTSVRDAAKAAGVKDFVLATNGSPKEVEELTALLAGDADYPVALHRFGSAYENEDVSKRAYGGKSGATGEHSSLQVAAIEQFLASEGEVFFGTHLSTFSMQIHHERRAAGKNWDESSRSVLPGPKLAKVCVYGDRDADAAKAAKFVADVGYDKSEECEYW